MTAVRFKTNTLKETCTSGIKCADGIEYICTTCRTYLEKNKIPPLAKANGVIFPVKPRELDLSELEERLVAARIPFMQLRELPRGGQMSLHGNIVNVPTTIHRTVSVLPRKMQEEECIPIQLKRKLSYKHYYSYEFVRPKKVMEGIEWLVKNSTLYQEEGIHIDQEWLEHDMQTPPDEQLAGNDQCEAHDKAHDSDEEEEYENEDLNAGPHDTLLDSHDLLEDRDILSVAPGEGNFPISVFLDTNAESLSFPSLFCGKEMKRPNDYTTKVHYSDLCKSELRRSDRRVAGHMPDIFFKMKKLQMKHILDKASICLRKTNRKSHDLTAGFLKSTENLKSVLQSDLGFRIFKELRGSPPYWEKVKKDLFTLIRVLGIPTWFASFSSADTRWSHLLQILGQTVDKKSYSEDEVKNFSWFKKQSLVKKDPVTCARHFDFQVRTLMKDVLQNPSHPIGEIIDFFYKIEFQMRGSPHVHMLLWIKDAPKIGQNDENKVLEFIDNHVSCGKSSDKSQLINLQVHSHSRTCKKKQQTDMSFQFSSSTNDRDCNTGTAARRY